MAKNKNKNKNAAAAGIRQAQRDAYVAALRDGRKERAATYADRRKVANKRACRGKIDF